MIVREGCEVASLDRSIWSERGRAEIEGRQWELGKDGSARTAVPVAGGTPMTARRRSVWSSEWQVNADSLDYTLTRSSPFTTGMEVSRGGAAIGTVTSGSLWSNRPQLEIDSSTPTAHAVFLMWMSFLLRART